MGEINFISNEDGVKGKGRGKARGENDAPDLEWTKPDADTGFIDEAPESNFSWPEKIKGIFNLGGGKKQPDSVQLPPRANPDKKESAGFFKNLFGFKKAQKPELPAKEDLVGRKTAIAEYGEISKNEKKARKSRTQAGAEESANSKPASADSGLPGQKSDIEKDSAQADKWEAPKILKTDLVKDEAAFFVDWKKNLGNLSVSLLLAALIIGIAYFGLDYWGMASARQAEALNRDLEELSRKITATKSEIAEIDAFHKKLNIAVQLLEKHVYWTNFFSFLENNTLTDVYYTGGFKGDLSGKFLLSAKAQSYEDLADQIMVFKSDKDFVVGVSADKGTLSGDDGKQKAAGPARAPVDFTIDLAVNPQVFYKK